MDGELLMFDLVVASGRVFTFGANGWGQLGLGHTKTVKKPMRIKGYPRIAGLLRSAMRS